MTNRKRGVWSEAALRVLRERYLLKREGKVIEDTDGMCWRVAQAIAAAEERYPTTGRSWLRTAEEFYDMMVEQQFLPNSPTLMNAGTGNQQQFSACFVLPVEDSIDGIFDALKYQALIHKSGGGTGFAFSRLRPVGSTVATTQGVASGPVSFMKIFDCATEQVKQGGKRRGANMGILRVDHPDILEFIACKLQGGISNFNISVAITDRFMEALAQDGEYELVDPHTRQVTGRLRAREVMDRIVQAAWRTGDPGLVFADRINAGPANPVPSMGPIEATNPCVTGDTLIFTDRGLQRAADLAQEGTSVRVAVDGAVPFAAASPVFHTGRKPVFRLETVEGYTVRLTADHRVMTRRGWAPACDLRPGDEIQLLSHKGGFGNGGSLALGRLLGWLVGDGTLTADRAVLSFFGEEKRELAPLFADMMESVVPAPVGRRHHDAIPVEEIPGRDEARVRSARFWRIAAEHGLHPGDKHKVPESVFTGSEDMQRGFLQALFTADGHVSGHTEKGVSVRLTSISKPLLQDVQRLLLNFGIAATIFRERRAGGLRRLPDGRGGTAEYQTSAYHNLVVAKDNLLRFAADIGFLSEAKQSGLVDRLATYHRGPYRETFCVRFLSLTPDGEEDVYDLTEPLTHSFVANGLVVHNCGEQPLYSFDACNLGSINLAKFITGGPYAAYPGREVIAWEELERITRLAVRFLDDVIEMNPFPLRQIQDMVQAIRRIGLGVMGWADMLLLLGVPYDSEEALDLAEQVMGFINRIGHDESANLARERGPFPKWGESIYQDGPPLRNATVTTIAPTGTISIIAGASSGVEPLFAIAYRHIVGERQLSFINPVFEQVARQRAFHSDALMQKVVRYGSVQAIPDVPLDVQRVFVTAHEIAPEWHVKMQAAFQAHTDNGVSKTINLPFEATVQDVEDAYMLAWREGCNGITVFRSGSKGEQVLYAGTQEDRVAENGTVPVAHQPAAPTAAPAAAAPPSEVRPPAPPAPERPVREAAATRMKPRPHMVEGHTYRTETPLGTAFITVNRNGTGEPFEVFLNVGKAGSDTAAVSEALGRLLSLLLRLPSPLSQTERVREIVGQLTGIGGGRPLGFGRARVRSLPDAIAHVLAEDIGMTPVGAPPDEGSAPDEVQQPILPGFERHIGDLCPECGHATLIFEEGCQKCYSCGFSEC
ncbi:MAG: ribonucleoside reductase class II [Chloroflexi bacterium]|nr:ribonucleoside reductase class II [Chloroflexota bacterium]